MLSPRCMECRLSWRHRLVERIERTKDIVESPVHSHNSTGPTGRLFFYKHFDRSVQPLCSAARKGPVAAASMSWRLLQVSGGYGFGGWLSDAFLRSCSR